MYNILKIGAKRKSMKQISKELQFHQRGTQFVPRWSLTSFGAFYRPASSHYMAVDGPKDPTPNDDVLSMGRNSDEED